MVTLQQKLFVLGSIFLGLGEVALCNACIGAGWQEVERDHSWNGSVRALDHPATRAMVVTAASGCTLPHNQF